MNPMIETLMQKEYLFALIVFVLFFVSLRLFIYVIQRTYMRLSSRDKDRTRAIKEKLTSTVNWPITIVIMLLGLKIGLNIIGLPQSMQGEIPKFVDTLVTIFVAYLVMKVSQVFTSNWAGAMAKKTSSKVDTQSLKLADSFMAFVIWSIALLFILQLWGIKMGPFLTSLGIAGVAVAFALQNSLGNIFGGVSMIMDKTIRVGDVVEIDADTKGTVLDVGLRSTKIRSWDNELIIIPNGKLADSKIVNYVQPTKKVRVVVPFCVAYGTDIETVKKIVLAEIPKVKNFINDPSPWVWFNEMDESGLNMKAYFFIESYETRFSSKDDATTRIYNALNKNKINIPFPQMVIHMKKDEE